MSGRPAFGMEMGVSLSPQKGKGQIGYFCREMIAGTQNRPARLAAVLLGGVVLSIAVLAAAWLFNTPQDSLAKESQAETDCQPVIESLQRYRQESGRYPSDLPLGCVTYLAKLDWRTAYRTMADGTFCRFGVVIPNRFIG